MKADPIVAGIRAVRHQIEAECGNDDRQFYDHILATQKKYGKRLVRGQPKPLIRAKSA